MALRIIKTLILCPFCKERLMHYGSIVLELSGRGASIYTYQWFKCDSCQEMVYGELEEFINSFDDDLIHIGYHAEPDEWEVSLKSLEVCPDLEYKHCNCRTHKDLKENGFKGAKEKVPLDLDYKT